MRNEVWVSSVMADSSIGNRQGIREKYFDEDWAPPEFKYDAPSKNLLKALQRYNRGEKLKRIEFPEAMYVFSEKHWHRVGEFFAAGPFYAVKGKIAEVLQCADLGKGELIEFPIYESDKQTKLPGPFYLLNFGAQKDSFLPVNSSGVKPFFTIETDGVELWKANIAPDDGDIAVAPSALTGADLWFERRLKDKIFMSGRLHDAILSTGSKVGFRFSKASVVGNGGEQN